MLGRVIRMNIELYDPEMCCQTGVCGASPDPELIRVGEMVEWLKQHGHEVVRYMLSRNPEQFTQQEQVYKRVLQEGMACLPIVTVDGELYSSGRYPTLDEIIAVKES